MEKKQLAIAHDRQDLHVPAIDGFEAAFQFGVGEPRVLQCVPCSLSAVSTCRPVVAHFPGIQPESIKVSASRYCTRHAPWMRLPSPLRIISGHAVNDALQRKYLVGSPSFP